VILRHLQYLALSLLAGAIGVSLVAALGGYDPEGFAQSGKLPAIISVAVSGGVMAVIYLGLLAILRNPELFTVTRTLSARFRRGR
jgi:putative peptidoglycan lipid II flippase